MPYKKSRFNFTYRQSEDAYVVFNTYSKALVVLSSAEFEQFNAQHFDDSQMVRELADNGILVDETFDEIGFMTYCHNMTKFSKGSLHLVLATTMDCNFACPYCYENRRKGKMSIAVQDAIVQFIEANINNGVHKLDVTWYGGEPLLYPDIVESLAARIRSLADRSGCELTMYMVTNGYLFTPDLVELIDRIGVVKVQITLDGLKEHHDSRRHLRDGRGTFDKIVENLRLFEEYAIRVVAFLEEQSRRYGSRMVLSKYLPIKNDSLGTRETRHIILNNQVVNSSRSLHSLKHTVPKSHKNIAIHMANHIRSLGVFPANYVLDLGEFVDCNGDSYIDIVELNPISCSMCYVNNSIYADVVPEISECQHQLMMGVEFCYDAIANPKNYDTLRISNKNYTYVSDNQYSFL